MDKRTAEIIAKKVRALKHTNKVIAEIDRRGEKRICINCTGVEFIVRKNDAMYLKLQTTRAQLMEDINNYTVTVEKNYTATTVSPTFLPAPIGSCDKNAWRREYYKKNREQILAYQKEWKKKKLEKLNKNS